MSLQSFICSPCSPFTSGCDQIALISPAARDANQFYTKSTKVVPQTSCQGPSKSHISSSWPTTRALRLSPTQHLNITEFPASATAGKGQAFLSYPKVLATTDRALPQWLVASSDHPSTVSCCQACEACHFAQILTTCHRSCLRADYPPRAMLRQSAHIEERLGHESRQSQS